jgi:hypothetical protein
VHDFAETGLLQHAGILLRSDVARRDSGQILRNTARCSQPDAGGWAPVLKNGETMNLRKKSTGAGIAALLLAAGALGGSLLNAGAASTTTTTTPGRSGAPAGPNTNPAHEAAESPSHAAAEASGKFPGHDGKFTPNTDPAHEKAESAAHAAQEAAGQFPTAP